MKLLRYTSIFKYVKEIETTSLLGGAYDFYSRVVKNQKRTSERKQTSEFVILHNE